MFKKASFESSDIEEFKKILEESATSSESDLSFLSGLNETNIKKIYLKHIDKVYDRVKGQYE